MRRAVSRPVLDDSRVIDVGDDQDRSVWTVFGVNGVPVPAGVHGSVGLRHADHTVSTVVQVVLHEVLMYERRDGREVGDELGHQPLISLSRTVMWSREEIGPQPWCTNGVPSTS